jgi:hypothetical protein
MDQNITSNAKKGEGNEQWRVTVNDALNVLNIGDVTAESGGLKNAASSATKARLNSDHFHERGRASIRKRMAHSPHA